MEKNIALRQLALVSAALLYAVTTFADGERNHYLSKFRQTGGITFYSDDGTPVDKSVVAADKGCDVTIVDMINDNTALDKYYDFYSWTIDATNITSSMMGPWCDNDGYVTLRDGGLTMGALNLMRMGHRYNNVRIKLSETQTWRGPASGTKWSEFSLGSNHEWKGNYYWKARIAALKDRAWTLDGRIRVVIAASNDLSNVDITVNPKARLILSERWGSPQQTSNPRLGAKSFTLKGGDTESSVPLLTIGAQNPETLTFGTSYAPSTFDDTTISPNVYLVDGACVKGGTLDYSVSELHVSGGDSTFSGAVTFKKQALIDVASGASLTFTGSVSADEGAGIVLSGGGSIRFSKRTVTVPISGNGTIYCDCASEGGEKILSGDLSGFTGTIYAASGEVLIHSNANINASATLSAAEGAVCRMLSTEDFGDYSEDGRWYHRDAEGIKHQYLFLNAFPRNQNFGESKFREVQDVVQSNNWINGSVFVIDQHFGGGQGLSASTDLAGIIVKDTATQSGNGYFDGWFDLSLGSRGIDIGKEFTLNFWFHNKYLKLMKSQVWRGPASDVRTGDDGLARINVGGKWDFYYPTGSITPMQDGLELALEGNLHVHLYYPSNDMSRADVIVRSPAKLTLQSPGGLATYKDWVGRLKAAKLTLEGVNAAFSLGKNTTISSDVVAPWIVLKDGASFSFTDKTWTNDVSLASAGTGGRLSGSYALQGGTLNLVAGEGSTLDMTDVAFSQAQGHSSDISVTGTGTLKVAIDSFAKIGVPIEIDGPVLELTGAGNWTRPFDGVSGLVISSSEAIYVSPDVLASYAEDTISVASGTLLLDSVASLPQNCKVVTSGTGKLALADATGFDPDSHMGGTKAVDDELRIITDEALENEDVSVGNGQTLHVFGSGLKPSSTVVLAAGSTLVFHKPATVHSPVSVTGESTIISVDAAATGTFAGSVTFTGSCNIYATGGIVFEGGGSATSAMLRQMCGLVTFRKKSVTMAGSNGGYTLRDGRCVVSNNCTFTNKDLSHWRLDSSYQTGDVTLEIAAGGTVTLGNNGYIYIGRLPAHESRLLINGGTFSHSTPDYMYINDSADGKSVIEFVSGNFVSQRRFSVNHKPSTASGYAKFIWKGGVWSTTGAYAYKYHHLFECSADSGIEFSVEGPDCVLDFRNFQYPDSISNFNKGVSTMIGGPEGRLTVKGKAGKEANLTLVNFTPNGMALNLNGTPSSDVEIVGTGDAVELGWVVPGTGGVVRCTGVASPLLANYVVSAGDVFENTYIRDGWYSGFTSATTNDLVFCNGATYLLRPSEQGYVEPLSISGALVLPESMRYNVARDGRALLPTEGSVVVDAAEGVEGAECTWTAASGILSQSSSMSVEDGDLVFRYRPKGVIISFR